MRIGFEKYHGFPPITIDDQNFIGTFAPRHVTNRRSAGEIIRCALENPLDSPPLAELAQKKHRVLILVDDNTRNTPTQEILPPIIAELNRGGVENSQIEFLVALGTHREMTVEETEEKFGRLICETFKVHMHQWKNEDELYDLGKTKRGTEILLSKRVMEADLVIGVGQIVPHRVAGYSGGCKIVQPGVCGERTTGQTHWLSAKFTGEEIMGTIDNPVREEMNRVGVRANLRFIVNAVMDISEEIVHVVCGDPIAAFREGARLSREIFAVEMPEKADIVVTDSYPADIEMWQASRGIYAADLAVREGGVIVMVSPCYQGVCAMHPDLLKYGYLSYDAVQKLLDSGELTNLTLAAHLVHVGRVIRQKATGILVSPGIESWESKKLGFIGVDHPQEALELALKFAGRRARIGVLQHAGHILPVVRS